MKRSLVGLPSSSVGKPFIVELKGVGWTQLDNTVAVTYDNAYIGYACGFNSNGYVRIQLLATGKPGTHLIDLYPLLYTQQPAYPYPQLGMVPLLSFGQDAPGLAAGLPAAGVPVGNQGRQVVRSGPGRRHRRLPVATAGQPPVQCPSTAMDDGTSTARTIVASMRTPSASPRPSCSSPETRPATKPANAAAMISAAALTIGPVRSRPRTIACALSRDSSHVSRMRRTRNIS